MKSFLEKIIIMLDFGTALLMALLTMGLGYLLSTLVISGGWEILVGLLLIGGLISLFENAVGFVLLAPFRAIWRLTVGRRERKQPETPPKKEPPVSTWMSYGMPALGALLAVAQAMLLGEL